MTRFQAKLTKRSIAKATEVKVNRAVSHRDKFTCRCCGRRADPNAVGLLNRGHHHHVKFRSAGGKTTRQNICLLCAECHDRVHHRSGDEKVYISGNADATLTFEQGGRKWFD